MLYTVLIFTVNFWKPQLQVFFAVYKKFKRCLISELLCFKTTCFRVSPCLSGLYRCLALETTSARIYMGRPIIWKSLCINIKHFFNWLRNTLSELHAIGNRILWTVSLHLSQFCSGIWKSNGKQERGWREAVKGWVSECLKTLSVP